MIRTQPGRVVVHQVGSNRDAYSEELTEPWDSITQPISRFCSSCLLLVFGAKRLPEIGRSLGSGMRGFKDSLSGAVSQPELPSATEAAAAPNPDGKRPVATS